MFTDKQDPPFCKYFVHTEYVNQQQYIVPSALLGHAESYCTAATSKLLALYLVRLSSSKPCIKQQDVAAAGPDACVLSTYWTHATNSNAHNCCGYS